MNLKSGVFGFIIGATFMAGVGTVIGSDTVVVGTLKPDISFKVDGKISRPSYNLSPINYGGYTYVPIRYVSELLGCDVEWNDYGSMIIIDYPKDKVVEKDTIVEKIVYVNSGEDVDGDVYTELPLTKRTNDFELKIDAVAVDSTYNKTQVSFSFTNNSNVPITVQQDDCTITVNDKEYKLTSRLNNIDKQWYNYIRPGQTARGYLAFDLIPEDAKFIKLKFVTEKEGKTISNYINIAK